MWWLVAAALASVEVSDPTGCVDPEAVAEGVAPLLSERVGVQVEVLPEGEARALAVRVLRRDRLVWTRDVTVQAVDCPHLAELVVVTVRQALAALPDLGVASDPWQIGGGVAASGSIGVGPAATGGRLQARVSVRKTIGIAAVGRVGATSWIPVGTGEGRLTDVLGGLGALARPGRFEVLGAMLAGVGVARGRGFAVDGHATVPRVVASVGGSWWIVGPWTVDLDATVPITRFALIGDEERLEAPVRFALGVGWAR